MQRNISVQEQYLQKCMISDSLLLLVQYSTGISILLILGTFILLCSTIRLHYSFILNAIIAVLILRLE